ncbi:MAG: hypothetical protein ACTSO7_02020 [Candidatus Heimdallarchaeota archaeon]
MLDIEQTESLVKIVGENLDHNDKQKRNGANVRQNKHTILKKERKKRTRKNKLTSSWG